MFVVWPEPNGFPTPRYSRNCRKITKCIPYDEEIIYPPYGGFIILSIAMPIISETLNYVILSNNSGYRDIIKNYLDDCAFNNKFAIVIDMFAIYEMFDAHFKNKLIIANTNWLYPIINKYKSNNKKLIVIIDALTEAPSYRYNFVETINNICDNCGLTTEDFIIFGGGLNQLNDPIKFAHTLHVAIVDAIAKHAVHDILPTKKFISLSRMPKEHRQLATVEILDRGIQNEGYISLGTAKLEPPHGNMDFELVPQRYKHLMPLYIDGEVDLIAQHIPVDDRFTSAFVNYVIETSYDRSVSPTSWNLPFLSEKSMKPFAWGQVPIFLNVANTIPYIRELGFDLFDDIIDHGYDIEPDPHIRIVKSVDQLQKICSWTIEDCRDYKSKNLHRFAHNIQLIHYYKNGGEYNLSIKNLQKTLDSFNF